MSPEPEDPILERALEAEIERAIGPVKHTLPPEILDELRLTLRLGLLHNPSARALLEELAARPSIAKSDKIETAAFKNRQKKQPKTGGRQ